MNEELTTSLEELIKYKGKYITIVDLLEAGVEYKNKIKSTKDQKIIHDFIGWLYIYLDL